MPKAGSKLLVRTRGLYSYINNPESYSSQDRTPRLIRSYYNKLFSEEEKKSFEFITLDYDMPFSLSVKTLSLFYNKSKVHLNTHPKERHGRAQAYALCSGLPIVGFNNLTYLVKKEFRNEPFYFVSENIEDFPKQLLKAIDYYDHKYQRLDHDHLAKNFRSADSLNELKKKN